MKRKDYDYDRIGFEALAARYFEAGTTEEEERRLAHFLCSPEGQDECFDEIRAVMGFAAVGRSLGRERRRFRLRRPLANAAVAAAVCIVGVLGWTAGGASEDGADTEACVAYVGGQKVIDTDAVMGQMRRSLSRVAGDTPAPGIEEQLGEMFEMLD